MPSSAASSREDQWVTPRCSGGGVSVVARISARRSRRTVAVPGPGQPVADDLAAGGLQWGGAGVGGEVVLAGESADVADLTQEPGRQHRPHPEQPQQAGVGPGDRGLDPRLDRGDLLSTWRTLGTSSVASCQRVTAGAPVGVTSLSRAAARLAVRLRLAPPGTRSISSRCSRLMVWVRAATRSWRRLVNKCRTTAWSSTPTWRGAGTLRAATATETASSGSLLRPCPTDSTRTRAASLAGTSRTCSPSPTSRWASARPMPWAPSTAQQRCGQHSAHPRRAW
jgi:hypothetical protein